MADPRRPAPASSARPAWYRLDRRAREDPLSLALLAAPVVLLVVMGWQLRWTHDDGFINFRIVDQVFAGRGPVYNPGQRVEAYTSPLWLFVLVFARALFGWAIDQAWLAVVLGIAGMASGCVCAVLGSLRLARRSWGRRVAVPFLVLVPCCLPPMWEYATAGLETGLAVAWIGASFLVLARLAVPRPGAAPATRSAVLGAAVLVGLGPLVRPELLLHTVGFLALLATGRAGRRWWRAVLVAGVALPVAYQVFRMGYFAAVVPNTALAKVAGSTRWDRGWYYFTNTATPYALAVPVLAAVGWAALEGRAWRRRFGGTDGQRLAAAMVVLGLVQGVYVVKVGGDYMHARMWLLPIFSVCCPLAVVHLPRPLGAERRVVPVVALAAWAVFAGAFSKAPPPGFFGPHAVADQRPFWVGLTDNPHPVTLDEWRNTSMWELGAAARRARAAGQDVLMTDTGLPQVDIPPVLPTAPGRGTWIYTDGIGIVGQSAGIDVPIIDAHGLADPIASRLPVDPVPQVAGHEKVLLPPWAEAIAGVPVDRAAVGTAQARVALGCGGIARLRRATSAPLSVGRFLHNLVAAPSLTRLGIPIAASDAARRCPAR